MSRRRVSYLFFSGLEIPEFLCVFVDKIFDGGSPVAKKGVFDAEIGGINYGFGPHGSTADDRQLRRQIAENCALTRFLRSAPW